MNISIAIISVLCYGNIMHVDEIKTTERVLPENWKQGRLEVKEDYLPRTTGENAEVKKTKKARRNQVVNEPDPIDGCSWVHLTKGKWAIVDSSDFTEVSKYNWVCETGGYPATGSCLRNGTYGKLYLHKFIAKPPRGYEVDHINGNRLDNRRSNLRLATRQQQCWNKGPSKNNTSGYKGVSWSKACGKWRASIFINWKQKHLGIFETREEAYEAYCSAAKELFGEFARLS